MNYDVIVVGAGLGGLTAGAKLAKEGKKVLVLEQHDRPGGCATTFKRKDFTMEVGLHEMDGLHPRDIKTKVFTELGIFDRVEFIKVPEFYRFVNGRHDIVIPHDPEEAMQTLFAHFPKEEGGIRSYFDHLLNARRVVVESRGKPDRSVGEFLDEIIGDEDLKLVLLGNLGYYHDDPYSISWLYYLTAQGSYFGGGGGNFVRGGSQKLSNALRDVIEAHGGRVSLHSKVMAIEMKDGLAGAVAYIHLKAGEKERITVQSKEIIVNAAVPNLASELLPEASGKSLSEAIKGHRIGASLLTVYFGFNNLLSEIGNKNYSTFIYDESVRTQADILPNNHSDFTTRSFTFVDYGMVDSGLAPKGKSVGAVCCIDYTKDWEGLGKEAYRKRKDEAVEAIIERCDRLIPGFRQAVAYVEVGTAKTVKRYTMNPEGAVYGFAQNPGKSTDYLNALPENVHIASAWGKFGGGFSGAIYSGYMTAIDVLRKR